MMRIKKNDTVGILSGKDKGKRGVVIAIDLARNKVMVKGVAMATHFFKARRAGEVSGRRVKESFIDVSKVMPVCSSCDKPTRVNIKFLEDSAGKVRVCNRCQASL